MSYATAAPEYGRLKGLTFATATQEDKDVTRASWEKKDVFFSAVILACILGAYIYFSG
jgi:SSS family solute:Na+ symporter